MLNPALLNTSGFLAAEIAPFMETPFPNAPAPESSHRERFSEFLAALERPIETKNDAPVREGQAAKENADEAEDPAAVAAEVASVRDIPAAAQTAVRPGEEAAVAVSADETEEGVTLDAANNEDGAAVGVEAVFSNVFPNDFSNTAKLAEAANTEMPHEEPAQAAPPEAVPRTDGMDRLTLQQADAGRNADEAKTRPVEPPSATTDAKNTEAPALDAGKGVYVDENTPAARERLAGADSGNPAETAARRGDGEAADGLVADGGTEEAVAPALLAAAVENLAAVESMAAAPPVTDGPSASAEKKAPAERGRRNTADERRTVSAAGGNAAAQAGETAETRRVSATGPAEAEITVNLRGQARDAPADGHGDGAKPAASFETLLARELQQNLNGSIVRQAQLMLREGGEGTIRLSLKPESLGKVKIHLEMAENKITGKIVVESGEALRAFEHEMRSLEQTFRGEGFDGASLSLELGGGRQNGEGRQQGGGEYGATRTASSRYGEASAVAFFGASYSAKQVNVLV